MKERNDRNDSFEKDSEVYIHDSSILSYWSRRDESKMKETLLVEVERKGKH